MLTQQGSALLAANVSLSTYQQLDFFVEGSLAQVNSDHLTSKTYKKK